MDGSTARIGGHAMFELDRALDRAGRPVEIGIRPEFVRIEAAGDAAALGTRHVRAAPAMPMTVRAVENVGRHCIVRGHVEGHAIDAVVPERHAPCRARRPPCSTPPQA